jgi:lysozyme
MESTEYLIAAIKKEEGFRSLAYRDEADVWTVGYGTTFGIKQDDKMDEPTADMRLRAFVRMIEAALAANLPRDVKQNEFDALVSLAYNVGIGAVLNSTLLKKYKAGKKAAATAQFARWNKVTIDGRKVVSRGLASRRTNEAIMFAGDD